MAINSDCTKSPLMSNEDLAAFDCAYASVPAPDVKPPSAAQPNGHEGSSTLQRQLRGRWTRTRSLDDTEGSS